MKYSHKGYMLIRFVMENIYSFGERKEFNMIPYTRIRSQEHHIYKYDSVSVLKMASIYGANGAGKSNLVKALLLLKSIVAGEELPPSVGASKFKFHPEDQKQVLAVEFIQEKIPFYYALEISEGRILAEELYLSGLGKKEDVLLFERTSDSLRFTEEFESEEKNRILKTVLTEEFLRPERPMIRILSNRDNNYFYYVKKAFSWFQNTLTVLNPDSRPQALAHKLDTDKEFREFAEKIMCSYHIGVTALSSEKRNVSEIAGEGQDTVFLDFINSFRSSPNELIRARNTQGEELVFVKEDGEIFLKTLKMKHKGKGGLETSFSLSEESDGTVRLLDFVPAFHSLASSEKVFIIDEMERSIHPLLIRELVNKFSIDTESKGQLVFTTHESHLLDLEIFRQDEIWFAEKDMNGSTDLYSLSDFKVHRTLDAQKGYLTGRYGAVPFLANLRELSWHAYDTQRQAV
ncbi:MAG TPA: ATP-binding protein [Leptospiraceae bacterium]|nr:ATP-binding protein [Leptospiraceae bacterium]